MDDANGCEVCGRKGNSDFGLCMAHFDEWIRSPERRSVVNAQDDDKYNAALDRFVAARRSGTGQVMQ